MGTALVRAAIDWARGQGLHKLCLEVFAHNAAGIAMYRKCGFIEEGRRVKPVPAGQRRALGLIVMGLLL